MEITGSKIKLRTKILFYCGVISGPLFILIFLSEGALREAYSPFRHPISSLSIGPRGWIQAFNFVISGSLILAFAFELRHQLKEISSGKTIFRLIALVGIGLIGAGICTTDPIYGYPMDQPLILAQFTVRGHLHDAFSLLVFICLPWACFLMRPQFAKKGEYKLARYSYLSAALFISTFVLAGMGFKQLAGFVNIAGLMQRMCIIVGCTWITVIAFYFSKNTWAASVPKK